MNYTPNCRLPQWEKSDRIMMDDFNQMCADIDAGIGANTSAANTLASQIAQVDQDARTRDASISASALSALKTGLFRNAYNHYHLVTTADPLPRQNGLFYQKLLPECAAQSGFSGFLARNDGAIWAAKAASPFTHKNLIEEVTLVQQMKIGSSSQPLIVEINAPGPGFFSLIRFAGTLTSVNNTSAVWRVTWLNLDTQQVEAQFEQTITLDKNDMYNNSFHTLDTTLYFHQARYRLTVTPVDQTYVGYYGLHGDYSFYATTLDSGTASIQKTLSMEEAGSDGMLSLIYQDNGGTIRLTWDGKVITPYRTHTYTDRQGRNIKEAEFRKGSGVGTSSTLKLDVTCQAGQSLILYDWGVILI